MAKIFRYILIGLVAILVLPVAVFGLRLAWIWARLQVGPPFYHSSTVSYWFLALFTLLPAALSIWIICRVAFWEKSLLLLVIPFFLVIGEAVQIPCFMMNPQIGVESQIFRLGFTSSRWGEEHGRLPATLQEIASAETGNSPSINGAASYYRFGNEPVRYEVIVLHHMSGPMENPSQLTRPGRIFYSLSEDGTKAWITGTGLDGEFTGPLCFLHDVGRKKGLFVDMASPGGHKDFFD